MPEVGLDDAVVAFGGEGERAHLVRDRGGRGPMPYSTTSPRMLVSPASACCTLRRTVSAVAAGGADAPRPGSPDHVTAMAATTAAAMVASAATRTSSRREAGVAGGSGRGRDSGSAVRGALAPCARGCARNGLAGGRGWATPAAPVRGRRSSGSRAVLRDEGRLAKEAAQVRARRREPRRDGAFGDADDLAGRAVVVAVLVHEHDEDALLYGQLSSASSRSSQRVTASQGSSHGVAGDLVVAGQELKATLAAQMVEAGGVGDAVEPCAHIAVAAEARQGLIGLDGRRPAARRP